MSCAFPRALQVCLRQLPDDVQFRVVGRAGQTDEAADAAALRDYFNLGVRLEALSEQWAAADARFRAVQPFFPGARLVPGF
jgi:N-glycosylase/DNA lyase